MSVDTRDGSTNASNAIEGIASLLIEGEQEETEQQSKQDLNADENTAEQDPDAPAEGENSEEDAEGSSIDDEEAEASEIHTISDLAEAIEVDPEFLYGLKMRLSESGEEVSLGSIKDELQEARKILATKEQVETAKKEFEKQREQVEAEGGAAFQQALQMPKEFLEADGEMRALTHQYNSIDWDKYEKENPGEAALQKQKFESAYAVAANKKQEVVGAYQKQMQDKYSSYIKSERDKIAAAIPEWSDTKVRDAQSLEISKLLTSYGFDDKEIIKIVDHRIIHLLNDLRQLKGSRKKAEEIVKDKGKNRRPRILKSGAPTSVETIRKQKIAAQKKAAAIGDRHQKVDFIADLIKG